MPLHPEAQTFLGLVADSPPLDTLSVSQIREGEAQGIPLTGASVPMWSVADTSICDVPVRVFRPYHALAAAVVYFHGGGWVTGSVDLADTTARDIAMHSGATVISVGYRKAPEHPFPAAIDDALAVTRSLLDGATDLAVDPRLVAVAGDSSGGNLAAVVAQQLAGHHQPLRYQVLVYPVLDATMSSQSYQDFGQGHYLTRRDMQFYVHSYASHVDPRDPRLSPGLNPDVSGVAPATIITAECDPLRDEGESYAAALLSAGVQVNCVRFLGQVHPFLYFPAVMRAAHAARRFIGSELRAAFETGDEEATD
ncbi:alpha/beta hydrolase [Streptomyces sp. NPDC048409]|uniref:alpha/beta hydrolase n=1 Tax=Streptomyces sp. NPDC048409 TaxID=3154723 RepID=UPI00343B7B82